MLAVGASPGQGTFAARHRKITTWDIRRGDDPATQRRRWLKYTVPMSMMPKLGQINATIQDPLGRYNAVMAIDDLYAVEPVN